MKAALTKVKIKDLHINSGQVEGLPKNPRFIKDARFEALKKSVQDAPEMLDLRPVVAYDNDGELVVIMGNMRTRACKDLGYKEVPTIILPKDTPVEKLREYVVKDNVAFGENDWDAFANEWDMTELYDWGLETWNMADILSGDDTQGDDNSGCSTDIEATEDDFDEETDHIEVRCKRGDIWQLGNHRLMCGDSTSADDVKMLMSNEKADVVFTDPPYDLEDISFFDAILDNSKEDCHIFCMSSDKHLLRIASSHLDIFKKFFSVDFRCAHLISNSQPMQRVDLICEFNRGKNKFLNTKDGFTTLIECAKIHSENAMNNYGHKQAKKVELPTMFIRHYSLENEIVLDVFGGSGTTLIASEQQNRKCRMMELDEHYCDVILARWEKFTGRKAEKIN